MNSVYSTEGGSSSTSRKVRVRLMGGLRERVGREIIEVEGGELGWSAVLRKAVEQVEGLKEAIDEEGRPKPGYLVFVDGVDYRLLPEDQEVEEEVIVLPVTHGGSKEVSGRRVELIHLTWRDIEHAVSDVADKIVRSGFEPEVIVGILRGGIVPALLLADALGVKNIGVVEIKLYTSVGVRKPRPFLRQPLVIEVKDKNVLIVDDVSDSGLTLQHAIEAVDLYLPAQVKTATLYIKPWTNLVPDYYSKSLDKWIVFPWERREVEEELRASGYNV
ncbi:phosphoribosyltransferase family protein [Aeropyrum camini]|uniref:Purine phosphoribosyltransferase n=1 Tax=Aeropyrum camini SY1 = JCM 12091 TaxID=1198449 RepID=U3TE97_9CREN|nr:phosphoribosyltransferase family protein [Aeropyrum camini]BAN90761.1 purine phosphoribosyltransferase [Aeropyrum camini SY1 = JCM 12091]